MPNFLQTERESLNYSSNDNEQYHWKDRIGVMRPETMARRQNDPGFMYYNNSGINVEANIDGEWKTIKEGSCIGHEYIGLLDVPIKASEVRLVVKESTRVPLIQTFALY